MASVLIAATLLTFPRKQERCLMTQASRMLLSLLPTTLMSILFHHLRHRAQQSLPGVLVLTSSQLRTIRHLAVFTSLQQSRVRTASSSPRSSYQRILRRLPTPATRRSTEFMKRPAARSRLILSASRTRPLQRISSSFSSIPLSPGRKHFFLQDPSLFARSWFLSSRTANVYTLHPRLWKSEIIA